MSKWSWHERFFCLFVKFTGWPSLILLYKYKKYYVSKKAKKIKFPKPCILVSNHTSLLDFPLYLCAFPQRNIRVLMAEIQFERSPILTWFWRKMGAIRVDRRSFDFSFIADSIAALDNGDTIQIYPQSRIPLKGEGELPYKPSAALIAMKSGAPLLPVYTDGQYGAFKRTRLIIGEPLYASDVDTAGLDDASAAQKITEVLTARMNELRSELEKQVKKK